MATGVLGLIGMVAVLVALVVGFAVPRQTVAAPEGAGPAVDAAERHVRRLRLVGLVLGGVVAVWLWGVDALGRGSMLAAVGFGLAFLVVMCVGELTNPVSRSARSDADLRRRRVGDYLPRRLSVLVAVTVVVLAALLIVGLVAGTADDLGRPGRALAWTTPTGGGSAGPWPGSFYAWPMLGALLVELALAGAALRIIAHRAQVVPSQAASEVDSALRSAAARGVVAATGVATAFPLGGLGVVMAITASNAVRGGAPGWLAVVVWVASAAVLLAVVTFSQSAASLLRSAAGRVVRDDTDERAEDLGAGAA
ncbi:hypothetical protein [Intrasporangium chromatireducens]|nr:hypothetical protein [Intrasporangium chromatireducens]